MAEPQETEEINPLFKLDVVLMFLYVKSSFIISLEEIQTGVFDQIKSDQVEISLILKKLLKDEYIEKQEVTEQKDKHLLKPTEYTVTYYNINFNGKIFLKQGAYTLEDVRFREQNKKLETLKFDQIKRDEFLKILTIWIAAGAIVASLYYSIEIYRECHSFFYRHGLYWKWEEIPRTLKNR